MATASAAVSPSVHHGGDANGFFHEEVDIKDMKFDEELRTFFWDCPCGDKFSITEVRQRYAAAASPSPDTALTALGLVSSCAGRLAEWRGNRAVSELQPQDQGSVQSGAVSGGLAARVTRRAALRRRTSSGRSDARCPRISIDSMLS
jgi:hypothetical protein